MNFRMIIIKAKLRRHQKDKNHHQDSMKGGKGKYYKKYFQVEMGEDKNCS